MTLTSFALFLVFQCALTLVASSHGRLPTTSSCARAMDLNMLLMDTLFVVLLLFLWLLLTAMLMMLERLSSPHGLSPTSVQARRDGGTKLQLLQMIL